MPDPLDALRLPVVPVEPRPQFAAALLRRIEGGEEAPAGLLTELSIWIVSVHRSPTAMRREVGIGPADRRKTGG